ncbi:MAG: PAC2 family protein [Candidatus Micrarchaeota archaeon]|nr:PAC2 family protein [Candidatus Micrarchaeota archaeon]
MVRRNKNILIVALYSNGLVGSLAGLSLVYSPGFELIEQKFSKHLPPVAVVHQSRPLSPLRLYKNTLYDVKIYLVISEISLSMAVSVYLYKYIMNIIKQYKIDMVFFLSSINDVEYNYITNIQDLKLDNMKRINEGAIGGPMAILLPNLHDRIPYLVIFAPTTAKGNVDVPAAISLLDRFREITNILLGIDLEINTNTLQEHQERSQNDPKPEIKDPGIYR